MPEFAPLVTRSPVMQKDFMPLTSRPISRPEGVEPKDANEVIPDNSEMVGSDQVDGVEAAPDSVVDRDTESDESVAESSDEETVARELALSASPLSCEHKPVISLHRSGENPDVVTGLRIVCRCGDVIDVSFETDFTKVASGVGIETGEARIGNEEYGEDETHTENTAPPEHGDQEVALKSATPEIPPNA